MAISAGKQRLRGEGPVTIPPGGLPAPGRDSPMGRGPQGPVACAPHTPSLRPSQPQAAHLAALTRSSRGPGPPGLPPATPTSLPQQSGSAGEERRGRGAPSGWGGVGREGARLRHLATQNYNSQQAEGRGGDGSVMRMRTAPLQHGYGAVPGAEAAG